MVRFNQFSVLVLMGLVCSFPFLWADESPVVNESPAPIEKPVTVDVPETVEKPDFHPIELSVPYDHPLVKKYMDQYTSNHGKAWLNSVMTESVKYRGYIQKVIKEKNLPGFLQYLPVIESSYKISALSRSGAYGLWQFMPNSVAPFNIRINSWMDERKDPWLSTDAALRKLKENYDYLGSWELALGAYNCGLGAMSKAAKRGNSGDFWYLADNGYLKSETKHYVPKFLAIVTILENKEYFGLEYPEPDLSKDESANFDTITVNRAIDLSILGEKSGIDKKLLTFYNPALYYNITPPDTKYALRLPAGKGGEIKELIESSTIPMIKYHMYTVKSGDTLYALSEHYGIPVKEIQRVNKIKGSLIKIGEKLMIPAIKDVGDFKNNRFNQKVVFNGKYKVQPKDTLWNLALKYNVQVETLAEENNMKIDDVLSVGSIIKVPIIE